MECIISTMEDTYILSLDHSLISGLITSSMFTLNTEKEDRKEKKKPWSCLSFLSWRLHEDWTLLLWIIPPALHVLKGHISMGQGESLLQNGWWGTEKGTKAEDEKDGAALAPGDYLLISEHLKRNSVGKRSKASIILNKRTRLIDFSHLYNFWKLDLS